MAAWDGREPPGDWLPGAYQTFVRRLFDPEQDYPCYFGVRGQRHDNNWFWLVDNRRPNQYGVGALAVALGAFRARAWTGPVRQSLVVFIGPPDPAPVLADHHSQFWRLLDDLTMSDPAPWPVDQPTDPVDPRWQWCFAGEPWFVFGASPAHTARRSRNLGPCLTIVFQTRRVFQGLGGNTARGQAAKAKVRRLLAASDLVPPHPHLGDANHSSTHKWRQYVLPDNDAVSPVDSCPFTGGKGAR